MFAGLLTDLQLMLEQRISGLVSLVEHGDRLADISAGLVITPHQCLDQ